MHVSQPLLWYTLVVLLIYFGGHPQVYLYTVPDFLSDDESQEEALLRWTADRRHLAHQEEIEEDEIQALILIVTGMDLFLKPKASNFLVDGVLPLSLTSSLPCSSAAPSVKVTAAEDVSPVKEHQQPTDSVTDCISHYTNLIETKDAADEASQVFALSSLAEMPHKFRIY